MIINIKINNVKDPQYEEEAEINRFPAFIGRSDSNSIYLQDLHKIISRKHSKIDLLDDELILSDLDSRNHTFLNDEKLIPNKAYKLFENDIIRIGDYKIIINFIHRFEEPDDLDDEKTMIFSSPFSEELKSIFESLSNLSYKYNNLDQTTREEYLKFSMIQSLSEYDISEINFDVLKHFQESISGENIQDIHLKSNSVKNQLPLEKKFEHKNVSEQENSFGEYFLEMFDILLNSFNKLLQGFWHFRQEFFGVTIYQSIPTDSLEHTKEFLFGIEDKEEEKKRTKILKDELNKILYHQIGLLEGYKKSVEKGCSQLLNELSDKTLDEEINKTNFEIGPVKVPYRYLPIISKLSKIDIMNRKIKLAIKDSNIIEQKYFRPAFLKGYQQKIYEHSE